MISIRANVPRVLRTAALVCALISLMQTRTSAEPSLSDEAPASPAIKFLHIVFGSRSYQRAVSIGDFTPDGPVAATLVPVDAKLQGVAYDRKTDTYYGSTMHEIGELDMESGSLVQFASAPEISWPKGIAFDDRERRLWISSADGGGGYLDSLETDAGRWLPTIKLGQLRFLSLAYCAEDGLLYGLLEDLSQRNQLSQLVRMTPKGAVVDQIKLSDPIFWLNGTDSAVQIAVSGGGIYLLVSQSKQHPRLQPHRLYRIRLADGLVEKTPYGAGVDLIEKLWPGMPDGPGPSVDIPGCSAEGPCSNYRTPKDILAGQPEEFHVISVLRGDVTSVEQVLQHLKSVKIDSEGISVGIDLESKPSAVEVSVEPSEKPIVLGLAAHDAVIWKVTPETRSRLIRVILLGTKDQEVIGIDKKTEVINHATGDLFGGRPIIYASAWELEKNPHADFDEMILEFRRIAGLRETSFQGCMAGKKFRVPFSGADRRE